MNEHRIRFHLIDYVVQNSPADQHHRAGILAMWYCEQDI